MSSENKDSKERIICKICVLGQANVGKTSLMERYCLGRFHGKRIPTVGADFMSKKVLVDGSEVILQIWDTAGQERFQQGTIVSTFYKGAHGAFLVYDVNDPKSFEQLSQWRDEAVSHINPNIEFPIIVIGNKIDIRDGLDRQIDKIDQSSVLAWCEENSYGHLETSCKDNLGVEACMNLMAASAVQAYRANITIRQTLGKPQEKNITLTSLNKENTAKKSNCC